MPYRLVKRSMASPFSTNLSLVMVPIGAMGIIIGPEVSRAFSIVFHRPELIYVWGAWLMLGGINVAWGLIRRTPSIERAGLYALIAPLAFYGISVIVGLGLGGLVTGPVFCVLALSCFQRARFILTEARAVAIVSQSQAEPDDETGPGQNAP